MSIPLNIPENIAVTSPPVTPTKMRFPRILHQLFLVKATED